MKIGIISDTHGCAATWRQVFGKYFSDAGLIIHGGDVLYHGPRNSIPAEYDPPALAAALNACPVPILAARGNCDAEVDGMVLDMPVQAPYAYAVIDGLRILVNHGHTLEEAAARQMARKMKASVLVLGHTHVAKLEKKDGVIVVNPGSPAMSKRADGRGTIARLDGGAIEILDIATGEVLAREDI